MQLLFSSPISVPQFFALSILLPKLENEAVRLADPMVLPGPTASLSRTQAVSAITELHETATLQDAKVQVFTTKNGLTMYFRVLNASHSSKLLPLVVTSTTTNNPSPLLEKALIVVSVGISGTGCLYGVSQTVYDTKQRLHDAACHLLQDASKECIDQVAESILCDTELLISNEQAESATTLTWDAAVTSRNNMLLSPITDGFGFGRRSSMAGGNALDSTVRLQLPITSTAQSSQRMLDQLTIMSVSEMDTSLKRFTATAAERRPQLSRAVARRRKQSQNDDLDGSFDYKGATKTVAASAPAKPTSKQRQQKLVLASSKKDTARAVRSSRNTGDDNSTVRSSSSQPPSALLVNLALNEDLTCAYRNTQLSSCVVEGVVQAQLRCTSRTSDIPLELSLHDPKDHLETVAENRKFAKAISAQSFLIELPKTDTYFPILKYKCTQELRPVPIRVQTKIKSENGSCRVALQISSNPHNNATLSDLTIMMGVPEHVLGETLQTQPPGGVWDQSKSSVLWCVSELGSGEKFQLQARFSTSASAGSLHFPVLVRCQCLQTQLSEIVLLTRDRPDVFPAELTTKVVRRYRVSHREKNDTP